MRKERCTHRWILSEPNVRGVRGLCRHCGASRLYPANLDLPVVSQEYKELGEFQPVVVAGTPEEPVLA
ncbi:MAG: hypothetical protein WBD55_01745 [Dehalococcoidia bacterium]